MMSVLLASFAWQVSAQQIWGVARNVGGANGTGSGMIYKTDANGNNFNVHYTFTSSYTGMDARHRPMLHSNGTVLYGVTNTGGNENAGVLYSYNTSTGGQVNKMFDFPRAPGGVARPASNLVQVGTKLYGVTSTSGANAAGCIYEVTLGPTTVTAVHSFTGGLGGSSPYSEIAMVGNKIYGFANGGLNSQGVLWQYNPSTLTYSTIDLASFGASAPLPLKVSGTKIYFVAFSGGQKVIFEYVPSTGVITPKYTFASGGFQGHMVVSNNKVYGIEGGGISEIDLVSGVRTVKHTFGSAADEGSNHDNLWVGFSGTRLYGTTTTGGTNGKGILFEWEIANNLFYKRFDGGIYSYPQPGLTQVGTYFYGVTNDVLTVSHASSFFRYKPNTSDINESSILHNFTRTEGPANPAAEFTKSPDGFYYGQFTLGGADNAGSVARANLMSVAPGWMGTIPLTYTYASPGLGHFPEGGTTVYVNGKMYGITSGGSTNGFGGIYEHFTNTGGSPVVSPVYPFQYAHSVAGSQNGLTTANGKLYGLMAKWNPATSADGIIYEYFAGVFTVKHSFSSATTGAKPMGKLTLASNGLLYGVTSAGGANNVGTIFEFDATTGTCTKRHDFSAATSGSTPIGNLMQHSNGKLYGLASLGGANNIGTMYEFDPVTFAVTKKHDFVLANGSTPLGALIESTNGNLYGTTSLGGATGQSGNRGVFFEYNLSTSTFTKKFNFASYTGGNPSGGLWFDSGLSPLSQTITITNAPTAKTYGDAPFNVTATASSGLPVTVSSHSPSVATVSGNVVTIVGAGTAVIAFDQAGDATYSPAQTVTRSIVVSKANQTITFPAIPSRCSTPGSQFTLSASINSPLPIAFTSNDPSNISISGNVVTILNNVSTGIQIYANQAGNANYNAAPQVWTTLFLNKHPVPVLSGPSSLCTDVNGTFSNSTSGSSYSWSAPGGTITGSGTSVSIKWPTTGTKTVSLSVSNGSCTSLTPASLNVSVIQSATPVISGPSSVCVNTTNNVYTTAAGQAYSWGISPGGSILSGQGTSSITAQWTSTSSSGSRYLTLSTTAINGCGTVTPTNYPVTVTDPPSAWINAPNGNNLCTNNVILTAFPAGASYQWSTGESTQSIQPWFEGTFGVTVTSSPGCSSYAEMGVVRTPSNCDQARMAADDSDKPNEDDIDQPVISGQIGIAPIPADRELTITFPGRKDDVRASIHLQDMLGRTVNQEVVKNIDRKVIDVTNHKEGLYIITIETATGRIVRKVLIQHP